MSPRFLEHDWFPAPLPDNVELGPRSWLYSTFAFRHFHSRHPAALRVGHDTGLYSGTFFHLGYEGHVEIGNHCTLVGAIIHTNGRLSIGDYTFIAHDVVLADEFCAVPCVPQRSHVDSSRHGIVVGENVWIGTRAVLLAGASIGDGAIIGAAAVVDFEVPPYTVVAGNPGRVVRSLQLRGKT